jgi:hypothetical protein
MSHMPRAAPWTVARGRQTTRVPLNYTSTYSANSWPAMHSVYIPLAQRTSDQLQASADELRRMAMTATTADVVRALLTLADRYAALANKRRQDEPVSLGS